MCADVYVCKIKDLHAYMLVCVKGAYRYYTNTILEAKLRNLPHITYA